MADRRSSHAPAPEGLAHLMPLPELAEAAQRIDEELDRQERAYQDAHMLRTLVNSTVQNVLVDLMTLDTRREGLLREVANLEAELARLKAEAAVVQAEAKP